MQCKGNFNFRSLEKRESGAFTNENGEIIQYDACYVLSVDEMTAHGLQVRNFRISTANEQILNKLKTKKVYDNINILFEVSLYRSNVKLIPIDLL